VSLFGNIAKEIEGELMNEVDGTFQYIDTGSYALNAVLSGTIYGGIRNNKVIGFAGDQATGKTFFVLGLIKNFLDADPDAGVVFFDSEGAIDKEMIEERGIDTTRFIIKEPETVEEFRTAVIRLLENYKSMDEKKRPPLLIALDSLGNLSSVKELKDIEEGSSAVDMTKAKLIKGAFRAITSKASKLHVPVLVTNHVYGVIGAYIPMKELSGGTGLKYCGSTIIMLSKAKDKDGKDVVGNIITVKMYKSRHTKENKQVKLRLDYMTGLDRYYGLLPIAEAHGVVTKVSTKYEFPDGTKAFEKTIYKNPEKYFTQEILDKIDVAAGKEFLYGSAQDTSEEDIEFLEESA